MKNKILWGAVIVLGVFGLFSVVSTYNGKAFVVVENIEQASFGGSSVETLGSSTETTPENLTISDDYTSLPSLYLWNTEGALEVVGDVYFEGPVVSGGSVTSLTSVATSTLTAAQVCDSSLLTIAPVTTTPTITFPPTSTLFADCLTSNGQVKDLTYKSITTSTIVAAGTGGTRGFSSSATVAAGKTERGSAPRVRKPASAGSAGAWPCGVADPTRWLEQCQLCIGKLSRAAALRGRCAEGCICGRRFQSAA